MANRQNASFDFSETQLQSPNPYPTARNANAVGRREFSDPHGKQAALVFTLGHLSNETGISRHRRATSKLRDPLGCVGYLMAGYRCGSASRSSLAFLHFSGSGTIIGTMCVSVVINQRQGRHSEGFLPVRRGPDGGRAPTARP
jgi:hypothetical protein